MTQRQTTSRTDARRKCGLCGSSRKALTRTPCCNQWICDDEGDYVVFSYARNSCSRNHRRMTLCGAHHAEEHEGSWKECAQCRGSYETEMYVWYGTNEYNFESLPNPPAYEPTRCAGCKKVILLAEGGYMLAPDGSYWCEVCADARRGR